MIGIKTDDDVYFLGDSIFSEETISKYHLFFLYDVKEFLNSLEVLSSLEGKLFIPSHTEASENILELIEINKAKVMEISNKIYEICEEEKIFEEILKIIFDEYKLTLSSNQYVLIGSTIRSYLSYLYEEEKLTFEFKDNRMYWKQK